MNETAARTPHVGEQAPDFTLHATSNRTVTLSEFRDRKNVLIAFFPLAFTSTCTAELCDISNEFDAFASNDVEVLPISVDATASLNAYKKAHDLKVDLLSDFRRDVSRAYGVLNEEKFYSNRSYFLVDKHGTLRWAHVEDKNGMKRENAELLAEIAKLGS